VAIFDSPNLDFSSNRAEGDDLLGDAYEYLFRSDAGRALVYSLGQDAIRYNLSKTSLLKLELCVPTLAEQRAIATLIADTDAELTALKLRRDKARAIRA